MEGSKGGASESRIIIIIIFQVFRPHRAFRLWQTPTLGHSPLSSYIHVFFKKIFGPFPRPKSRLSVQGF
jgi:hypothetical protein